MAHYFEEPSLQEILKLNIGLSAPLDSWYWKTEPLKLRMITIVAGIRIILMSVPGSIIITSNLTPPSPRPSSIPSSLGQCHSRFSSVCVSSFRLLCVSTLHGALSKVQYHTKQTGGTPRSGRARTQLCWNVASTKFSAIASFRTGAGFDSSTKTFADILWGKERSGTASIS